MKLACAALLVLLVVGLSAASTTAEMGDRALIDAIDRADAAQVTRLLGDHRAQLESLAQALLKAETLDAPEAYAAAGVRPLGEATAGAVSS